MRLRLCVLCWEGVGERVTSGDFGTAVGVCPIGRSLRHPSGLNYRVFGGRFHCRYFFQSATAAAGWPAWTATDPWPISRSARQFKLSSLAARLVPTIVVGIHQAVDTAKEHHRKEQKVNSGLIPTPT